MLAMNEKGRSPGLPASAWSRGLPIPKYPQFYLLRIAALWLLPLLRLLRLL
jgi:hypothetical protein